MHDIGKVNTPTEILNKPDKLSDAEFAQMKQHVVDGPIFSANSGMPLAAVVAFEHHLRQDLSGYPEHRTPGLEPVHANRQHRGRVVPCAASASIARGCPAEFAPS